MTIKEKCKVGDYTLLVNYFKLAWLSAIDVSFTPFTVITLDKIELLKMGL